MGIWQAAGKTVRGSHHCRQGQPAQDAMAWRALPSGIALAVADGHGSAPSARSDVGARLAVGVATALLAEVEADATTHLDRDWLARQLVERWRAAVRQHRDVHPLAPGLDEDAALLRYGTTLLAVLATERELLYCQIGDGDILLVSPAGQVRRPWARDPRLLGVETTSLCLPDAWREVRVGRLRLDHRAPALVLLCTDGYANSFRTERGFLQVGRDILLLVRAHGIQQVERDLEVWLDEVSRLGSGDDVTAGLLYRVGETPPPELPHIATSSALTTP